MLAVASEGLENSAVCFPGNIKRTVWGLLFVGIVTCMVVNLTVISRDFLSGDVVVNIDLHQHSYLDFPAVTVCNTNPVRRSAIGSNARLQEALASEEGQQRKRRKRSTYEGN